MTSIKKWQIFINILLVIGMCIHVGVKMVSHNAHPEYSAPAYTSLIYAIYYIVPIIIINIIFYFVNKRI